MTNEKDNTKDTMTGADDSSENRTVEQTSSTQDEGTSEENPTAEETPNSETDTPDTVEATADVAEEETTPATNEEVTSGDTDDSSLDSKEAQQESVEHVVMSEEIVANTDPVENKEENTDVPVEAEAPKEVDLVDSNDAPESSEEKPTKDLSSEVDLTEKGEENEDHEEHEEEIDYTTLSKAEFVELIKKLSHDDNIEKSDKIAKIIKPLFDEIQKSERAEALNKFVADGGEEADFDYKYDELDNRFDANLKLIRDRRSEFIQNKEKQKDANLKRKEEILEKLREFVDSEETNISFDKFKELQEEWRNIGPIPGAQVKTLWANYNALVDRFYDNRSIYFELKELDRKKNLESKLELCEKAEKLSSLDNLKEAIKELNELHHEFKHLGPVPKDDQEALWQRFKAASDAVYSNRKEFVEKLKVELEENLKVKEVLAEDVQIFVSFDSDRIKEWNTKTKEILDLQKKWEATGGLPRAKAKEVNRKFWNAFKTFFHNKSEFFKKLDAQREGNLDKKKEMVSQAQELKDSTDWQKTTNIFKKLQADWREIGPVPEKFRESVYKEFKEACDHFFDQKRASQGEVDKEFDENLKKKQAICDQITAMIDGKDADLDKFRQLQDEFSEIGFVPRKSISSIKNRYAEVVDKFINNLEGLSQEEKEKLKLENQLNKLIQGPNAGQKLYRKEQAVRKQINQVENDIAVWKNNLEFFAHSKTADKLREEFETKIDSANDELVKLKQQLKIIRTAS